jgi:glutathione S-transferase
MINKQEIYMLKLYQVEWCPYCQSVRSKMTELELTYINVNVPGSKPDRKELIELAGKPGVPTLVCEDGTIIADDDRAIIEYLEKTYASANKSNRSKIM